MKKVVVAVLAVAVLAGCQTQPAEPDNFGKQVDELYRAVVKYQVINGTTEEQAQKPISDEQVRKLQDYMKGVTNSVYGETAGR